MTSTSLKKPQGVPGDRSSGYAGQPLPRLPDSVNASRIPQWDLESLSHRACPVCNADSPQFVCCRPDKLKVVRCSRCEMLYLSEIPSRGEIAKFYEQYGAFKRFAPPRLSWRELKKASSSDPHIAILKSSGGLE